MKKSTHLVNIPGTSTNSEPDYFNEHGDPVYAHTHMVHVKETNWNKHLIQFPISTDFKKVRNSQDCSTVLLKADTGVGVNLMNSTTFDRVIGDRSALQPTSLQMETYGNNTAVEVLGKFHMFLRWKGKIYRQLFYVTNANASPNLLSRDSCYTLGVLKPCYSVERSATSSKFQEKPQVTSEQPTTDLNNPRCMVLHHIIWQMKELVRGSCLIPLRTSLECTLMYSLELGSFQDLHTSSS